MTNRRKFIEMTSTALLAAPFISNADAIASDFLLNGDQESTEEKNELIKAMTDYLTQQLENDRATANIEIPYIMDIGFNWHPPVIEIAKLDRIVAYAFGNRPNSSSGNTPANGGVQVALPDPGPTNEMLADTVYAVYQQNPVKVYAQWEIARFLKSKYNLANVTSIEPIINPNGSVTYLSTDGVAAAVVQLEGGNAANMGIVGVVGFRDHVKRCVLTSQGRGMNAYAPAGIPMPGVYDTLSGQAWTRRREIYLIHDMLAQMAVASAKANAAAYPHG